MEISYFSSSETRRLLEEELETHMNSEEKLFTFWPLDSQYKVWEGSITGIKGSVYERGTWRVKIELPQNFPLGKPDIKFKQPVPYHPNVREDGVISTHYLYSWDSFRETNGSIYSMIYHVAYLLNQDNFEGQTGHRPEITNEYLNNRTEFIRKVNENIAKANKEFTE